MSNIFTSSIGRKLIMSITGAAFVLFLLFHMTMNLVVVFSPSGYDAICAFLGANWYALLATMALAALFLIHILYAIILTLYNRKARGNNRYAVTALPKEVSWASRNMFILGVIVILGVILHLSQFWYKMQFAEIMNHHEVALGENIVTPTMGSAFIAYYFSQLWVVIAYLVWIGALWFHVSHGFWSAFQSLGWNNQTWLPRLKCISTILATLICVGFAVVVVIFYVRSIC